MTRKGSQDNIYSGQDKHLRRVFQARIDKHFSINPPTELMRNKEHSRQHSVALSFSNSHKVLVRCSQCLVLKRFLSVSPTPSARVPFSPSLDPSSVILRDDAFSPRVLGHWKMKSIRTHVVSSMIFNRRFCSPTYSKGSEKLLHERK